VEPAEGAKNQFRDLVTPGSHVRFFFLNLGAFEFVLKGELSLSLLDLPGQ
jgi:hypothetical protein